MDIQEVKLEGKASLEKYKVNMSVSSVEVVDNVVIDSDSFNTSHFESKWMENESGIFSSAVFDEESFSHINGC